MSAADRNIDEERPAPADAEVIRPPTSGPTATAMPTTVPQNPNALARSAPRNACPSTASAALSSIAAPTPCSARAVQDERGRREAAQQRRHGEDGEPTTSMRRRPNRSASAPAGHQKRGESEDVGADHPFDVGEGGTESRAIEGSETATMFESSMIMNDTPEAQSRTRARRPLTHLAGRCRA